MARVVRPILRRGRADSPDAPHRATKEAVKKLQYFRLSPDESEGDKGEKGFGRNWGAGRGVYS